MGETGGGLKTKPGRVTGQNCLFRKFFPERLIDSDLFRSGELK